MSFLGSIASIVTRQSWSDLGKLLREMQTEINQLKTANSLNYATIDRGGITVANGGAVTVKDTSNRVVAIIGSDGGDVGVKVFDTSGNLIGFYGTGTGGTGLEIDRPDKSVSLLVNTSNGGFFAVYDRSNNYIVTDDTTSGQGLARPYIPIGFFSDNSVPTQTTTSSTFTTLQSLVGYKQHPKVWMQILVYSSDASTTGEVRVVDQSNNVVGGVQTISAGTFAYINIGSTPLAGTHELPISLNIQARRTGGTGTIGVRGTGAWGVESAA